MFYAKSTGGFYDVDIHGNNIPQDAVEITNEEHTALLEGQSQGKVIVADKDGYPVLQDPPPPSLDQVVSTLSDAVRSNHLDKTAKERGYDSIVSLCSYATSTVAKYASEGHAGVVFRDQVWEAATPILNDVLTGAVPAPTAEELIEQLPTIVWPTASA